MEEIEYNTYAKGKKIGTFKGSKPIDPISGKFLEEDLYISDYVFMKLYDENKQTVEFDIALKQDWDIFPRSYQRKDPEQGVYKEIIEKILIDAGIENPVTHIKEIIRVDLDGDGIMEVIIKGWYYEGEYYQVYKLIDDELEAVAVNGFGV